LFDERVKSLLDALIGIVGARNRTERRVQSPGAPHEQVCLALEAVELFRVLRIVYVLLSRDLFAKCQFEGRCGGSPTTRLPAARRRESALNLPNQVKILLHHTRNRTTYWDTTP